MGAYYSGKPGVGKTHLAILDAASPMQKKTGSKRGQLTNASMFVSFATRRRLTAARLKQALGATVSSPCWKGANALSNSVCAESFYVLDEIK